MCVKESAVGGPLDQNGAPLLHAFQTQRPATVGTFTYEGLGLSHTMQKKDRHTLVVRRAF